MIGVTLRCVEGKIFRKSVEEDYVGKFIEELTSCMIDKSFYPLGNDIYVNMDKVISVEVNK